MSNAISSDDLQWLLQKREAPCISLYMPAGRAGEAVKQQRIRFKNLVSRAERLVAERGLPSETIAGAVSRWEKLILDEEFWQHQDLGFALFENTDFHRDYRLPSAFDERVVVGTRFHVAPLLPLIAYNRPFYVLTLNREKIRLILNTAGGARELRFPDIPEKMEEVMPEERGEHALQYHTGLVSGRQHVAMYHGHGEGRDSNDTRFSFFIDTLRRRVEDHLPPDRKAFLVVAGSEQLVGLYHEGNGYQNLLPASLHGNFSLLPAGEIAEQVLPIVHDHIDSEHAQAAERLMKRTQGGISQALHGIAAVVPAAYAGRVDVLLTTRRVTRWGTFDPETNLVFVHEEERADDEELVDRAIAETLSHRGMVYTFDADRMPFGTDIAAVLRY